MPGFTKDSTASEIKDTETAGCCFLYCGTGFFSKRVLIKLRRVGEGGGGVRGVRTNPLWRSIMED